MSRKVYIADDFQKNKVLAEQMATVRGGIVGAAFSEPCPERFLFQMREDTPAMEVIDRKTGRSTTVPLFACRELRAALQNLFA